MRLRPHLFSCFQQCRATLALSGFRRNDQAASPDILALLRPGDPVLRDLGYFCLEVLAQIEALVALPVPEETANQRRHRAKTNRNQRWQAGADHLYLLGWNIFLTNVSGHLWSPQVLPYRGGWSAFALKAA